MVWADSRAGACRSRLRAGVDRGPAERSVVAGPLREQAEALTRGHGMIVAEFVDVGESRTVARLGAWCAMTTSRIPSLASGWDAGSAGDWRREAPLT